MRVFLIFTTIGIMAFTTSGENAPGEKVDRTAINFESRHLSTVRCDSMNYIIGRELKWDKIDESLIEMTVTSTTDNGDYEKPAVPKTPFWVSALLLKGETYQIKKTQRAKRYQDRLSGYSQTELSIAKKMDLSPWDIDRKLLKRWGQETDAVLLKL